MVLDIDFMTLNILKLDFFLYIPWIHYELDWKIKITLIFKKKN
jgi:hypothetical protein